MATVNPFDLLGDDDNDDPSHLIALQQQKLAAAAAKKAAAPPPPAAAAKLPSKPLPPAQAVRENRGYGDRGGGGGGGGFGRGRGRVSFQNREFDGTRAEEGDGVRETDRGGYGAPRGAYRGGRRGGYNGDVGGGGGGEFERPARRGYGENSESDRPARREYERHSGTDRGYGMKREGAGRGNWGTTVDDGLAQEIADSVKIDEKIGSPEKNVEHGDAPAVDAAKEGKINEPEEKDEDKEMTLEEYEKVREEKRKALLAMKTEERKVDLDKEFESMQQLSLKKENSDVFIKLGSDKEGKKKESAERDERAKKSVSIQQFLKPAEGERYYSPGARGRGRGRGGDRAPFRGGFGGGANAIPAVAPPIEDPGHFPTLGGK